jgi:hypothetical protein
VKKAPRKRYTDGEYLCANPTWHEEDSPWKATQIKEMLQKNNIQPRSICDIGCGVGGVLEQLHGSMPKSVSFTGYDISPQAYALAKEKERDRLRFYGKDFFDEDDYYDVLLVIDVLEHIEDYFGFLRKIKSRSVYKLFHIPLDISVQRVLLAKPIMRRRRQVGHIHYFTKETALATLEDAGYEILDHFYTASTLDLPSPSLIYALGKWPLRVASLLNKDLAVRILGGHSLMVLAR